MLEIFGGCYISLFAWDMDFAQTIISFRSNPDIDRLF